MKSGTSLEMGHVRLKTRSLGQMSEKHYAHSRGHIFCQIIMKRDQNVCLDEISDRFENGSCWVKTRSLVQILENLMYALRFDLLTYFQTCLRYYQDKHSDQVS